MTKYGSVDVVKVDMDESIPLEVNYDSEYPFGESKETFDDTFWKEVKDLCANNSAISRVDALRKVRVRRLKETFGDKDLLVELITTKHDAYLKWCNTKEGDMDNTYPTFVFELSNLVSIILDEDFEGECKYLNLLDVEGSRKNILHLAAGRNLTHIMTKVLNKQNNVAVVTASPGDHYPLHFAIENNHDDAASLLIRAMASSRVRDLFAGNEMEGPRHRFCDLITRGDMKKTVEAVLDCLMNPDWPFIPTEKEEEKEDIAIPNMPFSYHFYYRILDGDEEGYPGKIVENGIEKENEEFNMSKTKSCLELLAENSTEEDMTIRHPVVRMLMRSKWEAYGRTYIRCQFMLYVLFLMVMSLAFLLKSEKYNRMIYDSARELDYFRMVCEIGTLIFTVFYVVIEIDQMIKEKLSYLTDPYNYCDILGLGLILAVLPLRLTQCSSAEYAVSAVAYFINFLRFSKCSTTFKSMSIYSKTFANIIKQEISRFALLFVIFMLCFSGTVFLLVKATRETKIEGGYWDVFLQEIRAIAEAQGYADDYGGIHLAVIILLMVNMFFVIVVLNNILIAQISDSYANALSNATIQYDIDRTMYVARIESTMFCSWSLRRKYYVDKQRLNDQVLEDELLEDWAALKQAREKKDVKKTEIKKLMKNKLKIQIPQEE